MLCSALHVIATASIHFDSELSQYHTNGGVLRGAAHLHIAPILQSSSSSEMKPLQKQTANEEEDDAVVVAPTLMFADALDLVFQRLQNLKTFAMNEVSSCLSTPSLSLTFSLF